MRLSAPTYQLKRRAKIMARNENIPLHAALDRVAQDEGYVGWSLLSARAAMEPVSDGLLDKLVDGDLLLLGARPGQGKTRMALRLLLEAAEDGRKAVFFTLEYTEREVTDRLRLLDAAGAGAGAVEIVASDDICAESIARHLAGYPRGTVAAIDYLQILDQRRSKPPVSEQVSTLQQFARSKGIIFGFISQIDRSFDPGQSPLPGLKDVRLPNPVEIGAFTKACFVHAGTVRFGETA